ncbi:MAG: primary-amine oxidase [Acidimicrobiales bacterium]
MRCWRFTDFAEESPDADRSAGAQGPHRVRAQEEEGIVMTHPLEPLTAEEITAAVTAVRGTGRLAEEARFSTITVDEPPKDALDDAERRARLIIVPNAECSLVEAVVAIASGEVVSWVAHDGARPALGFEESFNAIVALHEDDDFKAALAARGVTDLDKLQIDPWPTGNFGIAIEDGRRIVRCLFYYRDQPGDNGYARPIEGLLAVVDMARGEVLEVIDHRAVPIPTETGSYYPEDNGPTRDDLQPLEITQPDGVSFTIDGSLLQWQRWSMRVSMDPLEGIVLHHVGYEDGDRVRSILHRASICEMVVPYGDPSPAHRWKNAFDVGEWGLGRMANSLTLGCDCLGEIHYLDAVLPDEQGKPNVTRNAICIHEEDFGILWKHVDLLSGRTEVRRSRRLVVSSIATVGNYEYGFYWYFYQDGSMELEVKLTGIMSTKAVPTGDRDPYAPTIAPGLAAPVHQHLFCARLDFDIDGAVNEVHETNVEPAPADDANSWHNAFSVHTTRLERELDAQRDVDPARSRSWKVLNPNVRNRIGEPVGYKLIPGSTPTLLAQEGSSIRDRARFATHNLWVTPYAPQERRAAGDFPNQHAGGDGLPRWTAQNRSLVDTDIVVWHTFGVTHVPRPEDWPVMPVERCGFLLSPVGFFDENPALDVASSPGHFH